MPDIPVEIGPEAAVMTWLIIRDDLSLPCTASAWMRPEHETGPRTPLFDVSIATNDVIEEESGRTVLNAFPPGRYLVDVDIDGCSYSLVMVPG
jgi:hypothetical protein